MKCSLERSTRWTVLVRHVVARHKLCSLTQHAKFVGAVASILIASSAPSKLKFENSPSVGGAVFTRSFGRGLISWIPQSVGQGGGRLATAGNTPVETQSALSTGGSTRLSVLLVLHELVYVAKKVNLQNAGCTFTCKRAAVQAPGISRLGTCSIFSK